MNKENLMTLGLMIAVVAVMAFLPDVAHAQFAGGFESKMQGLTTKLITVILPLVSVLGLVYAVILALTGDGSAKGRIIMVIVCSIIGFLAPHIIGWFQSAAGQ
jgi:type IV secretory pathway VirB2 component (pilin)